MLAGRQTPLNRPIIIAGTIIFAAADGFNPGSDSVQNYRQTMPVFV